MAPSKNNSHSSNCDGENVLRQANVLASCYVVDTSSSLTGFHYSTTGAGAALTSANELALQRKSNRKRDINGNRRNGRKGGAAYHIRGECERLFCETMKTVFLGEGRAASNGSIVMGANAHSPPDERLNAYKKGYFGTSRTGQHVDAWVEVWDYASGCSFRGFVGGNNEKTLFTFFDSSVVGQDLKQGLMALIELSEAVFACSQVVICLDRSIPEVDSKAFMKSLRWVGFELITMDMWATATDTTSDKWLLLGMEV
ncbi:ornithine decarboxylase antizyme [Phlyctema vagabunda]|uniref:Ornithine decarboxylase antizyme n=1 Tax=Phlyctema vagabunda TaxID=108571 RepID=A0ABR4PML3_9HELO